MISVNHLAKCWAHNERSVPGNYYFYKICFRATVYLQLRAVYKTFFSKLICGYKEGPYIFSFSVFWFLFKKYIFKVWNSLTYYNLQLVLLYPSPQNIILSNCSILSKPENWNWKKTLNCRPYLNFTSWYFFYFFQLPLTLIHLFLFFLTRF